MAADLKVLVVGGGVAGMCCAVALAQSGHTVELIDSDSAWRSYGAGITVQAPMFRALRAIGVSDRVAAAGFPCRGTRARAADGTFIGEVMAPTLEPGLPDGGGIMRPVLHAILADAVRAAGVRVRLGMTWREMDERVGGVEVGFEDGSRGTFDLIVGADGIFSALRARLFPDAPPPRFTARARSGLSRRVRPIST